MLKVGVNGFGRIGRNFLRASLESGANFEIVGINDLTDNATLAHLLKYDSILGRLKLPVTFTDTTITVGGKTIAVSAERDPANIPWGKLGADVVVDPINENLDEILKSKTNNIGPDVVIEAVGSIPTYEASVALVRRGGRILAYGAAPQDASMQLRPFDIYAKELTIIGSYAGTYDTWPRAINLIAAGRFNPSLIVDTILPLSEAVAAIKSLEKDRSIVKIHIQIP